MTPNTQTDIQMSAMNKCELQESSLNKSAESRCSRAKWTTELYNAV